MIKFEIGWIKLLEQKTWVFFSLAIFAAALRYLLDRSLLPFLSRFTWLPEAALLAAALFGILAVGSLLQQGNTWAREQRSNRKNRKVILTRLNSLSGVEHRILSYLVQANNQSFNYRADDGDVQGLVGKGLLFTPPGQYNFHMVPFIVPDFVWRELKKRSAEFTSAAPPEDKPWVKDWMAY